MLKIVHEGEPLFPGVHERCCICRKKTPYWHDGVGELNVALCEECAKTTTLEDLPTKSEWAEKEGKLTKWVC